jgi:diguanylate cyclase (GGDEF)-like protein
VISLAVMLGLALVLGLSIQQRLEERALGQAERTAEIVGAVAVRTNVPQQELRNGLSDGTVTRLNRQFSTRSLLATGVMRVKLFDGRRRLVYTDGGRGDGQPAGLRSNVAAALTGKRVSHLTKGTDDDGHGTQMLSVYLPLLYEGSSRPAGAFEIYLDYRPTAAAVWTDVRTLWAVVAIGFLALWAALFRVVASVSRALRRQVAENRRQATHDALTGLPNRRLLYEAVTDAIAAGPAALLLIDLDRFKEVNDTLGHDHGDVLLCDVASRLRAVLRPGDVLARLGGDEFAVLRPGVGEEADARILAEVVRRVLAAPVDVGGTTVAVEGSVGLALAPVHGDDVMTLVKRADVAMYQAKRKRSGVEVYEITTDHHHPERLALIAELPRAMRDGELVLAYQPKIDLGTGRICGVEALVRWQHPERGLLPPGAFIPAAELTSAIRPLTLYVLDHALAEHRRWADDGLYLPVAVNLAAPSIVDQRLPSEVARLLAKHRIDGGALTLEISEGTIMADAAGAVRVLSDLRALGVRLSLDDFGTGQTSLAHLRRLPLDELKIDRSFVMAQDGLVGSVVEIAHRFGLRVVGEGVETGEVAGSLVATGCDEAQGFLYAKPMWAQDVSAWVAEQRLPLAS